MNRLLIGVMVWCALVAASNEAWCNGDGTERVNNMIVLKDAGCLGEMSWYDAMARVKTLANGQCGLTDKSKAGDWRLPTIDELRALSVARGQFTNVQLKLSSYYWSSTTDTKYPQCAWYLGFRSYYSSYGGKDVPFYAWAVRTAH